MRIPYARHQAAVSPSDHHPQQPQCRPAPVIWFADARALSDQDSSQIDPRAAERMIRAVYTDKQIGDQDGAVKGRTQIILLAALIADEQLDEAGLDALLADAAKLAGQWLA